MTSRARTRHLNLRDAIHSGKLSHVPGHGISTSGMPSSLENDLMIRDTASQPLGYHPLWEMASRSGTRHLNLWHAILSGKRPHVQGHDISTSGMPSSLGNYLMLRDTASQPLGCHPLWKNDLMLRDTASQPLGYHPLWETTSCSETRHLNLWDAIRSGKYPHAPGHDVLSGKWPHAPGHGISTSGMTSTLGNDLMFRDTISQPLGWHPLWEMTSWSGTLHPLWGMTSRSGTRHLNLWDDIRSGKWPHVPGHDFSTSGMTSALGNDLMLRDTASHPPGCHPLWEMTSRSGTRHLTIWDAILSGKWPHAPGHDISISGMPLSLGNGLTLRDTASQPLGCHPLLEMTSRSWTRHPLWEMTSRSATRHLNLWDAIRFGKWPHAPGHGISTTWMTFALGNDLTLRDTASQPPGCHPLWEMTSRSGTRYLNIWDTSRSGKLLYAPVHGILSGKWPHAPGHGISISGMTSTLGNDLTFRDTASQPLGWHPLWEMTSRSGTRHLNLRDAILSGKWTHATGHGISTSGMPSTLGNDLTLRETVSQPLGCHPLWEMASRSGTWHPLWEMTSRSGTRHLNLWDAIRSRKWPPAPGHGISTSGMPSSLGNGLTLRDMASSLDKWPHAPEHGISASGVSSSLWNCLTLRDTASNIWDTILSGNWPHAPGHGISTFGMPYFLVNDHTLRDTASQPPGCHFLWENTSRSVTRHLNLWDAILSRKWPHAPGHGISTSGMPSSLRNYLTLRDTVSQSLGCHPLWEITSRSGTRYLNLWDAILSRKWPHAPGHDITSGMPSFLGNDLTLRDTASQPLGCHPLLEMTSRSGTRHLNLWDAILSGKRPHAPGHDILTSGMPSDLGNDLTLRNTASQPLACHPLWEMTSRSGTRHLNLWDAIRSGKLPHAPVHSISISAMPSFLGNGFTLRDTTSQLLACHPIWEITSRAGTRHLNLWDAILSGKWPHAPGHGISTSGMPSSLGNSFTLRDTASQPLGWHPFWEMASRSGTRHLSLWDAILSGKWLNTPGHGISTSGRYLFLLLTSGRHPLPSLSDTLSPFLEDALSPVLATPSPLSGRRPLTLEDICSLSRYHDPTPYPLVDALSHIWAIKAQSLMRTSPSVGDTGW